MKYINHILCLTLLLLASTTTTIAQLNEGFEGSFPPDGWTVFDNGNGTERAWIKAETEPYSGSANAYVRYEDADGLPTEDWLVTPKLTPSGGDNMLTFYAKDDLSGNFSSRYTVRVSTVSQTEVATFTTVFSFRETDLNNDDTYKQFTVDLSAYDGMEIYVAFVLENQDGDSFLLDEVAGPAKATISSVPNCDAVLTTPANNTIDIAATTNLTWNVASGDPMGYKLSIGTSVGGTDVLNAFDVGNTTTYDPAVDFNFNTRYYVTVLPYNGMGDAATGNCQEIKFTTQSDPNTALDCQNFAASVNKTLCYGDDATEEFMVSSNSNQVKLTFTAGTVENNQDEIFIYDGIDDSGTLLNGDQLYGNDGDLTGLNYISSGNTLFVRLISDASNSCQSSDQTTISYTAECIDCVPPLATASFGSCDEMNGMFTIDLDIESLGSSTELTVLEGANVLQTVNATGVVNVGPFSLGTVTLSLTGSIPNNPACAITLAPFTQLVCPPANDACANPTALTVSNSSCSGAVMGTTLNATPATIDSPCEGIETDDDVWYSFTPGTGNGGSYTFELSNLDFTTSIVVYEGGCGALVNLNDCVNDNGQATVDLLENQTYLIQVFTNDTQERTDFDICVYPTPLPPANDVCGNPTAIDCSSGTISGEVATYATAQGVSDCNNEDVGQGLWYSFTGNGQNWTIGVTPNGWDAEVQIFSGVNCSNLNCEISVHEKGSAKKENITNFLTTMGEQYYLYIGTYSQSALAGTFDINISCATALATELVNFTGVIADENNVIRWKVADEWNIKEYVVERSADGQKDW
ncbi:MAG: choice-of-anchor J domain-containing protein, partial [Saprospiraceae bacterium]